MDNKERPMEEAAQTRGAVAGLANNTLAINSDLKKIFPHPVTTLEGSVTFAKQFTFIVLSLITYTRGIFPAYAFSEKLYRGYAIKVLSGRRVCFDAHLLTKWLKSAFAALEKGYMRELIFEIVSLENVALESYSVLYEYKERSITCSLSGTDESVSGFDESSFQRSVSRLISTVLRSVKQLGALPEAYRLQLRILYYNDKTPETFTPNYFRDTDVESYEKTKTLAKSLGRADTPYHGITMKIASCYESDNYTEKEKKIGNSSSSSHIERKRKFPIESKVTEIDGDESKMSVNSLPQMKNIFSENYSKKTEVNPQNTKSPTLSVPSTPKSSKASMNCICALNADRNGIFQCFKCTFWHHLVCYRRKPTSVVSASTKVACVKCASENSDSECLDALLVTKKLPLKIIEKVAVFRQVVFKLRWFALISASTLVKDCHVHEEQAKSLIEKLVKKKLISPCTRSGDYNVHTSEVIAFISGYFR